MFGLRVLLVALVAALGVHVGIGHHDHSPPTTQVIKRAAPQPLVDLTMSDHPCGAAVVHAHQTKHKTKSLHRVKHKKKNGAHPSKHKPGKHKPKHHPGNGHGKHHSPQPHPKKIPQPHLTGPPGCR